MYESVIIDPENKTVEQSQTGLFYTAISRGTILGDDDGLNSAVYFTGDHLTKERIQDLTKCMRKDDIYLKVKKRTAWVNHLKKNSEVNDDPNSKEAQTVFTSFKGKFSYDELHSRIQLFCHAHHRKSNRKTQHFGAGI